MKKIFAFFLTLALLLPMSVIVSAETVINSIEINFNAADVKLAKEFDITVSATNNHNSKLYGGEFLFEYDSSVLEIISVEQKVTDTCPWETEILYSSSGSCYITFFADLSANTEDETTVDPETFGIESGEKIDFVFTVKAIGVGTTALSVNEAIFIDEFFDDVDFNSAESEITLGYPTKISGASLQLGSGIHLSFYALLPDEYKDAQMCFSQEFVNDGVAELDTPTYSKGNKTSSTGSFNHQTLPKYDFKKGIQPQRLGDEVYAYVVYNGVAISETKSYSVLKYCNHIFKNGSSAVSNFNSQQYKVFETLLCDLLKYGEASQIYEGYNTSNLVTSLVDSNYTLVPSEFQKIDSNDFKLTEGTISDPKFSAVSLLLGSTFKLSYKVNATSIEGIKIRVSYFDGTNTYYYYLNESSLKATSTQGVYYLYITPEAKGIDYVYTLTIYDAAGNKGRTVSYSVKSYVDSMQNNTTSLGTLVKTLYNYGKSVANYADAIA